MNPESVTAILFNFFLKFRLATIDYIVITLDRQVSEPPWRRHSLPVQAESAVRLVDMKNRFIGVSILLPYCAHAYQTDEHELIKGGHDYVREILLSTADTWYVR